MTWSRGKTFHLVMLPLLGCVIGLIFGPTRFAFEQISDQSQGIMRAWLSLSEILFQAPKWYVLFWLLAPPLPPIGNDTSDMNYVLYQAKFGGSSTGANDSKKELTLDLLAMIVRLSMISVWEQIGRSLAEIILKHGPLANDPTIGLPGFGLIIALTALWAYGISRNPREFEARLRWGLSKPSTM